MKYSVEIVKSGEEVSPKVVDQTKKGFCCIGRCRFLGVSFSRGLHECVRETNEETGKKCDCVVFSRRTIKSFSLGPGDVSFSSDQPFEDFLLDFVESFSFSSDKNDFLPTRE